MKRCKIIIIICVSLCTLLTGCSEVEKQMYEQYFTEGIDLEKVTTDGISMAEFCSLTIPDGYTCYKTSENDLILLNYDNSVQILVQNTGETSIEEAEEKYELKQSTGETKIADRQALVFENEVSDSKFDSYTYLVSNSYDYIVAITTYYVRLDYEDSILQTLDNLSF